MQFTTLQPAVAVGEPRWYVANLFRVLVSNEQTDGAYSLLEMTLRQGFEPPAHYHEREDEAFYVLEGRMRFYLDGEEFVANAGEAVFLPRMVPHAFRVDTMTARVLLLLTPGDFANFFLNVSEEAPAYVLPAIPQGPPPPHVLDAIRAESAAFGIQYV